jgi:hypothetical protein
MAGNATSADRVKDVLPCRIGDLVVGWSGECGRQIAPTASDCRCPRPMNLPRAQASYAIAPDGSEPSPARQIRAVPENTGLSAAALCELQRGRDDGLGPVRCAGQIGWPDDAAALHVQYQHRLRRLSGRGVGGCGVVIYA